ncbi:MAG: cell wall hydrolase [Alistipes sp.]|nr:cell wall hydrolase [Alistipes sp.]
MNSKSKRIFLYILLALMVVTQVAFTTSDETVKSNTESIPTQAESLPEQDTADNTIQNIKTASATAAAMGEVSPVVVVEEDIQQGQERLLGETENSEVSEYQDMIVCYADPYLPVRTEADRESKTVGKLYPGSYADVLERGEDWSKVKSGNVVGYIQNMYVCFDSEAEDLADQLRGTLSTAMTLEEEKAEQERLAKQRADAAKASATAATVSASSYEVCLLAAIIDWEAGSEPYEGKLAVGYVVVNRVNCGYGGNIQAVLSARGQFGGVTDGNGNWSDRFQARVNKYLNGANTDCMKAAQDVLAGANNPLNATYLNFNTVVGACSQCQQIGNHIFYNR